MEIILIKKNRNIIRNITIKYDKSKTRTYPLFESYTENHAKQLSKYGKLDTSFMISGDLVDYNKIDEFVFTSLDYPQYVTMLIVPQYTLDNFNLTLETSDHKFKVYADTTTFSNWIQVYVAEPTSFRVKISLAFTAQFLTHPYRLLVVGSTSYIPASNIKGPYIKSC